MEIKRTEEEIYRVLDWASEKRGTGSRYPRMSYEDGIIEALDWILGRSDEAPGDEE